MQCFFIRMGFLFLGKMHCIQRFQFLFFWFLFSLKSIWAVKVIVEWIKTTSQWRTSKSDKILQRRISTRKSWIMNTRIFHFKYVDWFDSKNIYGCELWIIRSIKMFNVQILIAKKELFQLLMYFRRNLKWTTHNCSIIIIQCFIHFHIYSTFFFFGYEINNSVTS